MTMQCYQSSGLGLLYQQGITLIPVCISNHILCEVWEEITYPFLNFTDCTVKVWEWINDITQHFMKHVISINVNQYYQKFDLIHVIKGAPRDNLPPRFVIILWSHLLTWFDFNPSMDT